MREGGGRCIIESQLYTAKMHWHLKMSIGFFGGNFVTQKKQLAQKTNLVWIVCVIVCLFVCLCVCVYV